MEKYYFTFGGRQQVPISERISDCFGIQSRGCCQQIQRKVPRR